MESTASTASNRMLMDILANHHVPVQSSTEQIEILGTDLKLSSKVFWNAQRPKDAIHLDVSVRSEQFLGNRTLVEAFAGAGNSLDEAVHNAFDKFCQASLHAIMAVFINRSLGEDQVEWEHWVDENHGWEVCLGPLLLQSNLQQGFDGDSFNSSDLVDALREAFLLQASNHPHWLRLFRGSLDGKCIGREVLLDNEPWPSGEAILDHWPFPDKPGYNSLRLFLIAIPIREK